MGISCWVMWSLVSLITVCLLCYHNSIVVITVVDVLLLLLMYCCYCWCIAVVVDVLLLLLMCGVQLKLIGAKIITRPLHVVTTSQPACSICPVQTSEMRTLTQTATHSSLVAATLTCRPEGHGFVFASAKLKKMYLCSQVEQALIVHQAKCPGKWKGSVLYWPHHPSRSDWTIGTWVLAADAQSPKVWKGPVT